MATKFPATKLRGPFKALLAKLKVVEFDRVKYSRQTQTGLAPSMHYKYGKNVPGKPRYEYATDSQGRITGAYAENLQLKPAGQERGSHSSKTPGKQPGDDAGHLFADQFDGGGGRPNLVSQLSDVNQGAWKKMEEGWAEALRRGQRVEVHIELRYTGNDVRPSEFHVKYAVDGVVKTRKFLN